MRPLRPLCPWVPMDRCVLWGLCGLCLRLPLWGLVLWDPFGRLCQYYPLCLFDPFGLGRLLRL